MTAPPDAPNEAAPLADQVALVTGAGRGIGRACAELLADAGARVIAVARTPEQLDELAAARPGAIETWCADVTSADFYARVEALPRLHVLVNNAGTNRPQAFSEVDPDTLQTLLKLNVEAAFRTAQAAARVMLREGTGGAVINMSSQMGHVGSPGRTVYCLTKHAVEGLTRAMAVELAPQGVRVNSVAPTFVETSLTQDMLARPESRQFALDRIPLGRVAAAADVARAVLFLASPAAGMITGDSLKVDGGWTAQ